MEIARSLRSMGLSDDEIIKVTGLDNKMMAEL